MAKIQKKKVKIDGFIDLNSLKVGGNALIAVDGRLIMTGAIRKYCVTGGQVFIETKNTIYRS